MNLKEIGKELTSKCVGTETSSYEKRIYLAAVSRRLRNTALDEDQYTFLIISRSFLFKMRNV